MMTQLTGLPVSNASLYDGAMAAAEAALLAKRVTRNKVLAISTGLTPGYLQTIKTYCKYQEIEIIKLPLTNSGTTDLTPLNSTSIQELAGIIIQTPNFVGVIEDLSEAATHLKSSKALLIGVVSEAVSMGILNPPGNQGADVVCGDAHSLGLPISFGGPFLGFFTVWRMIFL